MVEPQPISADSTAEPAIYERPATSRRETIELMDRLRGHGFRWLIVADALALLASMTAINLVRFGFNWPTYPVSHYAIGFAIATAIHLIVYYFGGLYEHSPRVGIRARLPRIAGLTVVAVLLDSLAALATGRFLMPRGNLAALVVVASLALAATRRLSQIVRIRRGGTPRVFLVGSPDDLDLAREHLPESRTTPQIVGSTSTTDNLVDSVHEADATDVLLVTSGFMDRLFPDPIESLELQGIGVLQRIGAQESMIGLREAVQVAGMPFVHLHSHTLPVSRAHFKRVIELVVLIVALPLIIPAALLVALYVRIAAGSGVILRQERVGKNGRIFVMRKFRTMVQKAEEGLGPVWAKRGDPRVIPACQWLRDTRLDEIPNLWNVLRGEMSIVGPRPERPELVAQFERLIPGYHRRHEIPPGITGLAQVQGSYHTDPAFKLGHDLQYLVNWSPVLDLEIATRTVWVIFARKV